ncbi:hypothetical protein ACIP98_00475 [Streptomyces sp. NPDC088354]|uniref:hypothetical protein n=1 Tax=unclassified Streptomyces TaxID=2593676 RepID=UPI0029A22FCC|nr:hypothetical protein [Streptomyces sp. MI02-7b]MDX3073329.1 hypothetical protein [Streptomyces sp. MI02-7b]
MAVSISLILLLAVLTLVLLRAKSLKVSHALLCMLLGFCLASSSLAPTIHSGLVATTDVVGDLRP